MDWGTMKQTRFEGLINQIDFYAWKVFDGCKLSKEQRKHLKELQQQTSVFGKDAEKWVNLCDELLIH